MAIRVFQIAKDFNRTPDEILQILQDGGVTLKSHTSELNEHARHVLRTKLGEFKLTVVDDDVVTDAAVALDPSPAIKEKPTKARGKSGKKADAEPHQTLGVRIIKRHVPEPVEEEGEILNNTGQDIKNDTDQDIKTEHQFADDAETGPRLRQPKLKRPRPRISTLQNRISQKIQEKSDQTIRKLNTPSATIISSEPRQVASPPQAPQSTQMESHSTQRESAALKEGSSSQQPEIRHFERKPYNKPSTPYVKQSGSERPGSSEHRSYDNRSFDNRPKPGGQGRPPQERFNRGDQPERQGQDRPPQQSRPYQQSRPSQQSRDSQQSRGPQQFRGPQQSQSQQGGKPPFRGRSDYQSNRPGQKGETTMGFSFQRAHTTPEEKPDAISELIKPVGKAASRYNSIGAKPSSKKKKKKKKNEENTQKLRIMAPSLSNVVLPEEELGIVMLPDGVTVKVLAEKVNRMAKDVIKRLFEKGVFATINDVLEEDLAVDVAKDFGYLAEIIPVEEVLQMEDEEMLDQEEFGGEKIKRAPIVTILGHVDHGKTSLLDHIRTTRVAEGESGGITQHIGAYEVSCHGESIIFLDTPGHEAFTKMRARGTGVTDIVILVVAADDGVMPQTVEAINHAKAAKVPILVAINKIDKPEARPDRVKQMLTEHQLVIEEYGGESPCVLVSAKTGKGIDDLLEMILLMAEMHSYKAIPQKRGVGSIIESKLERGRGAVATVLVQDGTIRVGDAFITGQTFGRIRALYSDSGHKVQEAGPSTPVEILGCQDVPQAGDSFMVVVSEVKAREIANFRKERSREEQLKRQKNASLDQLFSALQKDEVAELSLIIKGDVQGSVEGLSHALEGIKSDKVQLRIIHHAVGGVTENDVLLAAASKAIIIGFRVRAEKPAHMLAEREEVEIRYYSIIYEAIQDVEAAMLGLMAPEYKEALLGRATVRMVFQIPRIGKIAGCNVDDGKVTKDAKARVLRKSEVIFDGNIDTLKRFKDDVNEVKNGYECGIGILGFEDFEENDVLEIYKMESVKATKLS